MALYFAKSTGGFYDTATGVTLPSDAVAITATQHSALMTAQAAGQVIEADANGNPQATAVARTVAITVQARAALSDSDTTMLRVTEAVALGNTSWNASDVVAFVSWRRALRAIAGGADTASTALPTKPAYPAGS